MEFGHGDLVIIKLTTSFIIGKIESTSAWNYCGGLAFKTIGLENPHIVTDTDDKLGLTISKIPGFNYSKGIFYITKDQVEAIYAPSPDVIEQFNSITELEDKNELETNTPIRRIMHY